MDVGKRITYYRKKQKITQAKLSELADMEPNNINRIEKGKAIPMIETLMKICNALKVTPNDLLLLEFDAPKGLLNDDIAQLLEGCSQDEYKKIIEYIHFVKQQSN